MNSFNARFVLCLLAALPLPALAGEGHGHDHGAPAASSGSANPRFSAVSEAFELVGILDGKQLTIYLDRFEDNTPVKASSIELEIGGAKLALTAREVGEYQATLQQDLPPGISAVTATIAAGNETDLLAGELLMPPEASGAGPRKFALSRYIGWGAAALAALAGLGAAVWIARRSMHSKRAGGAA